MKSALLFAFAAILLFGCAGTKTARSPLAIAEVYNYTINEEAIVHSETTYLYMREENEFYKFFAMSRSIPGKAFVPDFEKESMVAIILPASEKIISIQVNKAEIIGKALQIHYSVADTTSWTSYAHTTVFIGMVPKNDTTRQVIFYRDKMKAVTLPVAR